MTEHTPTPWKVDETHITDATGNFVASTWTERHNFKEAVARAQLIQRLGNAHSALVAACRAALRLPSIRTQIEKKFLEKGSRVELGALLVEEMRIEQQLRDALAMVEGEGK